MIPLVWRQRLATVAQAGGRVRRAMRADLRRFFHIGEPTVADVLELAEWLPHYDGATAAALATEYAPPQATRRPTPVPQRRNDLIPVDAGVTVTGVDTQGATSYLDERIGRPDNDDR